MVKKRVIEMRKKENMRQTIATILLVWLMPIGLYYTPGLPWLSLGDTAFVIITVLILWDCDLSLKVNTKVLAFPICVAVSQIIAIMRNNGLPLDTQQAIHKVLFYGLIAFIVPNIRDNKKSRALYIQFAKIATTLMSVQMAIYYATGRYISMVIPFLPHQEVVELLDKTFNASVAGISFRPRSIFVEPSHYAVCMMYALCLLLDPEKSDKDDIKTALFISVGMLISKSSTAVGFCGVLWLRYLICSLHQRKKDNKMALKKNVFTLYLLAAVPAVVVLVAVLSSDWWNYMVYRTFGTTELSLNMQVIPNSALDNRIGDVARIQKINNTLLQGIIGSGVIKMAAIEKNWFTPEFANIYLYWGLMGYVVIAIMLYKCFKNGNYKSNSLLLSILLLSTVGGSITGASAPLTFLILKIAKAEDACREIELT